MLGSVMSSPREEGRLTSSLLSSPSDREASPTDTPSIRKTTSKSSSNKDPIDGVEDLSSLRRKVSDLPDLTEKLREQGTLAEYVEWRNQYMRWRKGEAKGAKGEHTVEGIKESYGHDFLNWYPTVKTFEFRRTVSFWGGVLFSEGCLLFLWVSFFTAFGTTEAPHFVYELTKLPTLCAGTMFYVGLYMAYFELINLDSVIDAKIRTERFNYFWCDWKILSSMDVEVTSVLGAALYWVGANFFTVAQVSDLFALSDIQRTYLVDWNLIIGGFLFMVGGVCELLINRVYKTPPTTYVWWMSIFNFIGGVCFWSSACPSLMPTADSALNVGTLGTFTYLFAAFLSLVMWQGEQFGGALIPALNRAQRDAGTIVIRENPNTGVSHFITADLGGASQQKLQDVLNPKLSWRGLLFLVVYIFIGAVQTLACCACMAHRAEVSNNEAYEKRRFRRFLNLFLTGFGYFVIVHMSLMLTSACVKMPKKEQEPYRTLMFMVRALGIVILANSVLTLLVLFESGPHYARIIPHDYDYE